MKLSCAVTAIASMMATAVTAQSNLYQVVEATASLSTLKAAIDAADLEPTLTSAGPFT